MITVAYDNIDGVVWKMHKIETDEPVYVTLTHIPGDMDEISAD